MSRILGLLPDKENQARKTPGDGTGITEDGLIRRAIPSARRIGVVYLRDSREFPRGAGVGTFGKAVRPPPVKVRLMLYMDDTFSRSSPNPSYLIGSGKLRRAVYRTESGSSGAGECSE